MTGEQSRQARVNALRNSYQLTSGMKVCFSANIPQASLMLDNLPVPGNSFNGTLFAPVTLTASAPAGYTFKGWSTDSSATTATYQSGGKATRSGNTRLYAVWEANTYNVQFNANGGTGAPSAQTKTYGQTLTLSSTVPTRTNYTFLGWSTSNTATTPTYTAGGSYTANASATLYAVWVAES